MPLSNNTKAHKNPPEHHKHIFEHIFHCLIGTFSPILVYVESSRLQTLASPRYGQQVLIVEHFGSELDCYVGAQQGLGQVCVRGHVVVVRRLEGYRVWDPVYGHVY